MAASVDDSNSAAVEDDPVESVVKCNIEMTGHSEGKQDQFLEGKCLSLQDCISQTSHGTIDNTSFSTVSSQGTTKEKPTDDTVSSALASLRTKEEISSNALASHRTMEETSGVALIQNLLLHSNLVKVESEAKLGDLTLPCHLTQDKINSPDIGNSTTESNALKNESQNRNCEPLRNSVQDSTELCTKLLNDLIQGITLTSKAKEDTGKHTKNDFMNNGKISEPKASSQPASSSLVKAEGDVGKTTEERPVREMLVRRKRSESTETSSENKPVLETLTFGAVKEDHCAKPESGRGEGDMGICPCVLCDRSYPAYNKEDVLAHLVLMHKFVIADVNYIANLPAYLKYWKKRMEDKPITEFCSKIVTNTGVKDEAPKEEFFLLCDALPEDKDLREHLQRKKLEAVLVQQQREREETKFCRQCLFCKQTYCGNRAVLFDHLLRDHTFHMGQPDNLVFTDELFDLIQSKLDNQLCLFCEKSFKDKASLREHMRKKQHRKINPKNKEYDKFYIINYMEMGKNWESLQSEDNRLLKTSEKGSDEEDEWSGWEEDSQCKVVCLFCDTSLAVQSELQKHMKDNHGFDLLEVNHKLQLNFYQKVKLINYIRRQIYHKTCYGCQETFSDKESLTSHMEHFPEHLKKVPDAAVWDQPQYFFPTYEDDTLLCQLDDDDDGASGDALGVTVIAEDITIPETILHDQKLIRDLTKA
ncbi:zinc finger protein 277-like [Biomphalaria glabrata]|uniref:Zinc finger protein 277-like n=1 Tax=Biomphalaria glabrata TaxID=6526 RepID=A0A9W3A6W7_BIOGL|nr:zinc finger protein 277-like [Biomphalaria glabrata]